MCKGTARIALRPNRLHDLVFGKPIMVAIARSTNDEVRVGALNQRARGPAAMKQIDRYELVRRHRPPRCQRLPAKQ